MSQIATPRSKGFISCQVYRDDLLVDHREFPNTVLRSGRRFLAAAMGGNLLGETFDAYIDRMAFGTGGLDGMNHVIKVPEISTTFLGGVGNIKDVVPVKAIMAPGDAPSVIFTGVIPKTANSNGQRISQIGLMMANGAFYAISTWDGFAKDASVSSTIAWRLTWL